MKLWTLIPTDVKFALLGVALAGVLGSYVVVFNAGISHEKSKSLKSDSKAVKAHAQIERKIMALPDADLDRRLSEWMRD